MISLVKSDESVRQLREALRFALSRNPDAYAVIGVAVGMKEDKLKAIAEGELEPTETEHASLAALA